MHTSLLQRAVRSSPVIGIGKGLQMTLQRTVSGASWVAAFFFFRTSGAFGHTRDFRLGSLLGGGDKGGDMPAEEEEQDKRGKSYEEMSAKADRVASLRAQVASLKEETSQMEVLVITIYRFDSLIPHTYLRIFLTGGIK